MSRSRWFLPLLLALAFVAGGAGRPARADNTDRIVQLLDRMADALRDIARAKTEPVRVVCECRGG